MEKALHNFVRDRSGITAIEYGVLACLMSLALVAAVRFAGLHVALALKHAGEFIKPPPSLTH